VFTSADISAMGARDLSDVLAQVPGLNVARSFYLFDPQYEFRGIWSSVNTGVLLLIDGVRRESVFLGGGSDLWASMPVDYIARVEVIRGPGSALYGADAVAGVISITTKRGPDMPKPVLTLEAGSRASRAASWQGSTRQGDAVVGLYLRRSLTDGPRERIDADVQSGLDAAFGTHASLAPGPMHLGMSANDAVLSLDWHDWRFNASLKERQLAGSGPGLAGALAPNDWARGRTAVASVNYQHVDIVPDWDLQMAASVSHESVHTHLVLFPPGAFGGSFAQGVIGEPRRSGRQSNVEAIVGYNGLAQHRLRLGVGWDEMAILTTGEDKNFDNLLVPGGGVQLVNLGALGPSNPATLYLTPHQRQIRHLLVQDVWNPMPDWTLTAGVRHDRYSDFGNTTNPRLALVWDASATLTVKLLHGRAFRAPSFQELYNNNFIAYGNSLLRPERFGSDELVLAWQGAADWQTTFNLFRYRLSDRVRFVPNIDPSSGATAANIGGQTGQGLEWEVRARPARVLSVNASVSFQHAHDTLFNTDAGASPHWMFKMAADWRLAPDWQLDAQARHVAGRQRPNGDSRPPIADYTLVDLNLRWQTAAWRGIEFALGVHNVFNIDARDPSPPAATVPNDYPLARRSIGLQAQFNF
jgi:iron complex outermembrane receptor protein